MTDPHRRRRARTFRSIAAIVDACAQDGATVIARGAGGSMGDAAMGAAAMGAADGGVLEVGGLDRFHHADWDAGALVVEPGVTFRDLFRTAGPRGWVPASTPRRSGATLGGAFAADAHGTDHRRVGGFSRAVAAIELRTASGAALFCNRDQNADVFRATVGGLGATGVIERLHLRLAPSPGGVVRTRIAPVDGLDRAIDALEDQARAYSVAYWGDLCDAESLETVKGALAVTETIDDAPPIAPDAWRAFTAVPAHRAAPIFTSHTNKMINRVYRAVLRRAAAPIETPLRAHLCPWDRAGDLRRLYAESRIASYAFVVPRRARRRIWTIVEGLQRAGAAPYRIVGMLMREGEGLLSCGVADGVGVRIEMPSTPQARRALDEADARVADAGGRVRLAEDGRLGPTAFRAMYGEAGDRMDAMMRRLDPRGVFGSAATRRLGLGARGDG
ncbi:MAG: FAD-binding oxidoreductase [Pseudomonadota bacterium]